MTPPIGINRGYLFGIGKKPYKDHVYVAESPYPFDPFANPKLCQAFDQSSVIVSEFQDTVSGEQALNEYFQTLPEGLKKALKPEDLLALKNMLEPLLDQMPGLKTCQGYGKLKALIDGEQNDAAAVTTLALFGILNTINSNRNRVAELSSQQPSSDDAMMQALSSRANLLSKQIVPLLPQGDSPKIVELFSLLMQEPELLRAILFAFTQKEIGLFLSDANAFERGSYEHDVIPDMARENLLRAVFSNVNIDLEKLESSPAIRQLCALLDIPNMSEKIAKFVNTNKRHLFLISPNTLSEWPRLDFPLTQIKIPLKPIGFFWTIRDDVGHKGILMGSMHITAEKLVNFPKRITELFDNADAIAVEIDATREDVIKQSEAIWDKMQAKELALLSPTEKEELFKFLKSVYPDMELIPTNEFDEQTQFLVQALQKAALQGVKTNFSGLKDKTTNQSFFSTGMEKTLIKRAKEKQIPIKDLETFDDHFVKFSSESSIHCPVVPYEGLKKMIEMSERPLEGANFDHSDAPKAPKIKSRDDLWNYLQKHPLQKMTDTVERGDLEALEIQYLTDLNPLSQANLVQRNRNMALQIDEFMKSGKRHFCIAGALHMAGPSSIVSILRQSGYKVDRLIVEEPLGPALDDDEKTPLKMMK